MYVCAQAIDTLAVQKPASILLDAAPEPTLKPKVLHAEPLYIDLIRDLGAHKGEKEWNVAFGANDNLGFDSYEGLVEYEWAVMDRLGLEIELPFEFFSQQKNVPNDSIPSGAIKSLKLAAQWTFLVSEKDAASLALGYINEFKFSDFDNWGDPLFPANLYNPFIVAAKRWGNSFHTLIYTGPMIEQGFDSGEIASSFEINTNFHYKVPDTRNFLGVEINQSLFEGELETTLRPQMRLAIQENLLIGIVAGIPVVKTEERFSTFVRLIWEPESKLKAQ